MQIRFLLLLLLLLARAPAYAADPTIDVDDFWARLAQTEALLQSGELAGLETLWEGVEAVRLEDGRVVAVDVGWIAAGLARGEEDLPTLQRQVHALLDHQSRLSDGVLDEPLPLAALDEVLRDPRFQYPDVTLTPLPTPAPAPPMVVSVGSGTDLTQLILLVVGVVVLVAVFVFFARSLQIQPTRLAQRAEAEDDPTTSGDARSRAEGLEAARDYRSAIRYLYLSSLLLLDERGVIRYDRTLTNREHLRQVVGKPPLFDVLRNVINAFEDVWYGFEPVDEAYYRQYAENVERLRQMVSA